MKKFLHFFKQFKSFTVKLNQQKVVAGLFILIICSAPALVISQAASSDWMGNNAAILGDKKLNNIKLPGAHDAGTYSVIDTWNRNVNDLWAPDTDDKKRALSMGGSGYTRWAKAQEKTIYEQLRDGIRYLDIRVCADKSNKLRICHGLYGTYLQTILNDVKRFATEHPKEIFIFDINHFFDWSLKTSMGQGNNAEYYAFRNEMFDALTAMIQSTIGNYVIPNSYSATSTLNQLWQTGKQIIVLYSANTRRTNNAPDFEQQYIWRSSGLIEDSYKDGVNEDKNAKFNQLLSRANTRNSYSNNFFVLTGQVTPSNDLYGKSFDPTGTYPHGLENLAKQTNPVLMGWVNNNNIPNYYLNIIQVDFYNQTCVVELCKKLNGLPNNMANCNMAATDWGNWKMGYEVIRDGANKLFDSSYSAPSIVANCPAGYINNGATCGRGADTYLASSTVANCPDGYTNMGLTCYRGPDTYGKGCTTVFKKFPCKDGYTDNGCFCGRGADSKDMNSMTCPPDRFRTGGRCYVKCKDGYTNNGEFCGRGVDTKDMGSMTCPSGYFKTGARCYVTCKTGYKNIGEFCTRAGVK